MYLCPIYSMSPDDTTKQIQWYVNAALLNALTRYISVPANALPDPEDPTHLAALPSDLLEFVDTKKLLKIFPVWDMLEILPVSGPLDMENITRFLSAKLIQLLEIVNKKDHAYTPDLFLRMMIGAVARSQRANAVFDYPEREELLAALCKKAEKDAGGDPALFADMMGTYRQAVRNLRGAYDADMAADTDWLFANAFFDLTADDNPIENLSFALAHEECTPASLRGIYRSVDYLVPEEVQTLCAPRRQQPCVQPSCTASAK